MSKFWQKKYTSKYTGAEIDAAVAKAGDATKVTANPTLAGTEAALEGLQVGNTKYKVVGGSDAIIVDLTADSTLFNALVALQTSGASGLKSATVPALLHPNVNTMFADVINALDNNITIPIYVICTRGSSPTYTPVIERIADSGHYRIRYNFYWNNGSDSQYVEYTYTIDITGFNTEGESVIVKCYTLFASTGN